ncbi:MAG: diguanylate cyclase [Mariprofundaceae bacterium]|nr:diguanylate cyclase [Mariprofundaceae bacterium]
MKVYPEELATINLKKGDIHVLIVGGGQGGLAIFNLLQGCQDLIRIDTIIDINPNAPAIEAAHACHIATSSDTEISIAEFDGDIIIDVTGHDGVDAIIQKYKKAAHIEVISGNSARLLFDIVCHHHKDKNTIQSQNFRLNLLDSMLDISLKLETHNDASDILQQAIQGIHSSLLARKSLALILDGDECQSFSILSEKIPDMMPPKFANELQQHFQDFDQRDTEHQYFELLHPPLDVPIINHQFDIAIPLLDESRLVAVLLIQLDGDISEEDKRLLTIAATHLRLTMKALKGHQRLEAEAICDVLTDSYNRRYFDNRLKQEVARIKRLPDAQLSCMFFDLDHFKAINDLYGHQAGDKVLQAVSERIKHALRSYDTFARFGGDEFIALLPLDEGSKNNISEKIARRILENIQSIRIANFPNIKITVSIGLATLNSEQVVDGEKLIQLADKALYKAKEQGRNCIHTLTIED